MVLLYIISLSVVGFIPNATVMDPGENRILKTNSHFFINGVSIEDDSNSIDVYQIDKTPPLNSTLGNPISFDKTVQIGREEYAYYAYFLNKGSTIDVSVNARGNDAINFYLCSSQTQFDSLRQSVEDGAYAWSYTKWFESTNSEVRKLHYIAKEDEMHVLMLENQLRRSVKVDFKYEVKRALYTLPEHAEPVCKGHRTSKPQTAMAPYEEGVCEISFQGDKYDSVVVMMAPPLPIFDTKNLSKVDESDLEAFNVTYYERPDLWNYLLGLGGLLFIPFFVYYSPCCMEAGETSLWTKCQTLCLQSRGGYMELSSTSSGHGSSDSSGRPTFSSAATATAYGVDDTPAVIAQPFNQADIEMSIVQGSDSPMPSAPPSGAFKSGE